MRPIIGITMNTTLLSSNQFPPFEIDYVSRTFAEAITLAGGLPVLIPINQPEVASEYLNLIDGLLITGGQDVSPHLYHQEPHKLLGALSLERDLSELALLEQALKKEKAILGVCRGMQLINVHLDGTLYQDIDDVTKYQHSQKAAPSSTWHHINIKENSQLSTLFPSDIMVNSIHHQAIHHLSPQLTATAWSQDNIIEAVEWFDDHHSLVAIQWHPELLYSKHPEHLAIFEDLVRRSSK